MSKLPERDDWIRLAAFLDGEGCIRAKFRRKAGISDQTFPLVHITNTDPRLIEWLQRVFGGHVSTHRSKNVKYRPRYDWAPNRSQVQNILENCRPFLLLKGEQADAALALGRLTYRRGHRKVPANEMAERESLKAKLHLLNAKGPRHVA